MNVSHLTSNLLTIQTILQIHYLQLFIFLCKFDLLWPSFDLDSRCYHSNFTWDLNSNVRFEFVIHNCIFVDYTMLGHYLQHLMKYFTFAEHLTLKDLEKVIKVIEKKMVSLLFPALQGGIGEYQKGSSPSIHLAICPPVSHTHAFHHDGCLDFLHIG